jgi:predicted nucleotide-binding protein (sugar kinase/HSP70/actin superfamily)
MRAMLLANAQETEKAMAQLDQAFCIVLKALEKGHFQILIKALEHTTRQLHRIPLKRPVQEVPVILLTGEIFVRRDGLSRQHLTEQLARKGFATICTPVAEWVLYSDFMLDKGLSGLSRSGLRNKLTAHVKGYFMRKDEQQIKRILAASGLVHASPVRIAPIIDTARPYISPYLSGEAILTVGSAINEIATTTCGVIAIGPFGCMPNRLSEAILKETMSREDKLASKPHCTTLPVVLADVETLPFLAIESDGSPFPQLQHAKLEAFYLQAGRLHQSMLLSKYAN